MGSVCNCLTDALSRPSAPFKQPCLPELQQQIPLTLTHLVLLPNVHPQRHQLQINDDVIQLRSDGKRNDVVHGQLVPGVRPEGDGGRLAAPHVVQACRSQAA